MKSATKNIFQNHVSNITQEYKKSLGIFYTDVDLAETMLKEINPDPNAVILDPCCGYGVFLDTVKSFGYHNVYGCDIDCNAVNICKGKGHKVIKWDSIFQDSENLLVKLGLQKQIDLIIGNPPYAVVGPQNCSNPDSKIRKLLKKQGNNLFIGSIIQSINLLKDNGILSYIIPKNFLHVNSYSALRQTILSTYKIVEIVDIGAHFKEVRGEQIIITLKKCKSCKNKITFKKYTNNKLQTLSRIPQNFYSDEIMIFNSNQDFLVYKKLHSNNKTLFELKDVNIHRGHS